MKRAAALLLVAIAAVLCVDAGTGIRRAALTEDLFRAARHGEGPEMLRLVHQGADLNARDRQGFTPLEEWYRWRGVYDPAAPRAGSAVGTAGGTRR